MAREAILHGLDDHLTARRRFETYRPNLIEPSKDDLNLLALINEAQQLFVTYPGSRNPRGNDRFRDLLPTLSASRFNAAKVSQSAQTLADFCARRFVIPTFSLIEPSCVPGPRWTFELDINHKQQRLGSINFVSDFSARLADKDDAPFLISAIYAAGHFLDEIETRAGGIEEVFDINGIPFGNLIATAQARSTDEQIAFIKFLAALP